LVNPRFFRTFALQNQLLTIKRFKIMETYYEVTYTDKQGNNKSYTRDTVERGYYLYKSLVSDGMENVVLREVSANGIAQLRPYTPSRVKEQP